MTVDLRRPLRVVDELIEQPSWGGRYIIDLKGLTDADAWRDKRVGQSYELARGSRLIDLESGETATVVDLVGANPAGFLGGRALGTHGPDMPLLIKLTQAKGNSFQVHLPSSESRGHWEPKPEAWFYLAPGRYTFGLKQGVSTEAFGQVLRAIDGEMHRLSAEVVAGRRTVVDARRQAAARIQTLDPYAYVNVVEAETDDVVDLTSGGIHHSWEEDDRRYPQGNLVYEVQLDVPDDRCSMRGFDKGKLLDNGSLRPVHVEDYLATIVNDPDHNDPARHVRKPSIVSDAGGVRLESIFDTPYFVTDRIVLADGAERVDTAAPAFHHLFVHSGQCRIRHTPLSQGQSYVVPAAVGDYVLEASSNSVVFKTSLPVY